MTYNAYIFDMDGTLIDSLPDLAVLTNKSLERFNFPTHTDEAILSFVGGGAKALIAQATPPHTTPELQKAVFETWRELYPQYGFTKTKPYTGLVEALAELRGLGLKTGVLSNKFDQAVHMTADRFFPDLFDIVCGEGPATPRKPDPRGLLDLIKELGMDARSVVYVGDTYTDRDTAANAGTAFIGVNWGYGETSFKDPSAGHHLITSSKELVDFARAHL